MKPSEAKSLIKAVLPTRRPIFISGPPGIGKSQIVAQIARELDYDMLDVRLLFKDPVDLRGLPVVKGEVAEWVPPSDLPFKACRSASARPVILFLDELPQAVPMVQNTASQLVLDRKVGEHELVENCFIIAAGNRAEDKAATFEMPSHLSNRFIHMDLTVDAEDWRAWAVRNRISDKILAFLETRPDFLFKFNPSNRVNATPRSWEIASDIMTVVPTTNPQFFNALAGTVGEGIALEFKTFEKVYLRIPKPKDILEDMQAFLKDTEQKAKAGNSWSPDQWYAILCGVVFSLEPKYYTDFISMIRAIPREYSIFSLKMGLEKSGTMTESLTSAKGWKECLVELQEFLV